MKDIKDATMHDLLLEYLKASEAMTEYEALTKVIRDEMADRLREMKLTGTKVDEYNISRVKRLVFTEVKMSEAEELGATKTAIDTQKLGALIKRGVKIKGVKSIEYVLVKKETESS